ncbi:anti-repressor SinI family protein [Ornithinibacillus salinisoli]|uniref:Anti-repressor SinI family protein n=1 Tax=Ornithinibacillus salinisoli TaxID=1848459 RepID=A0ABW4VZD3_9BACI
MEKIIENVKLDCEWVELMKEARSIGMTVEEVRLFLSEAQQNI